MKLEFTPEDFNCTCNSPQARLTKESPFWICQGCVFAHKANARLAEMLAEAPRIVSHGTPESYSDLWECNTDIGSVQARLVNIEEIGK